MNARESRHHLDPIYRARFGDPDEDAFRARVWKILCAHFFQQYVPRDGTVLDLGAGYCHFVNAIEARRKIAVDLNPQVEALAASGVEVVVAPSTDLSAVPPGEVDVVFSSNLIEHLPDPQALLDTLAECRRVLRPGGTLVVLAPNIRYVRFRFWDFVDHTLPVSHSSLCEALAASGFTVVRVVPRFLPYTVRDARRVRSEYLVRLYLRLPVLWRVFGRQMLVVARSPAAVASPEP